MDPASLVSSAASGGGSMSSSSLLQPLIQLVSDSSTQIQNLYQRASTLFTGDSGGDSNLMPRPSPTFQPPPGPTPQPHMMVDPNALSEVVSEQEMGIIQQGINQIQTAHAASKPYITQVMVALYYLSVVAGGGDVSASLPNLSSLAVAGYNNGAELLQATIRMYDALPDTVKQQILNLVGVKAEMYLVAYPFATAMHARYPFVSFDWWMLVYGYLRAAGKSPALVQTTADTLIQILTTAGAVAASGAGATGAYLLNRRRRQGAQQPPQLEGASSSSSSSSSYQLKEPVPDALRPAIQILLDQAIAAYPDPQKKQALFAKLEKQKGPEAVPDFQRLLRTYTTFPA